MTNETICGYDDLTVHSLTKRRIYPVPCQRPPHGDEVRHWHDMVPYPPDDCGMCADISGGFGPSHNGSRGCESGSIASGGHRSHCTCDRCF